MDQYDADVVQAISKVKVTEEREFVLHRKKVPLYQLTDDELNIIVDGDIGFDLNVFVGCISIATTILVALPTTEFKTVNASIYWHGGLYASAAIAILSLLRIMIQKKGLFKTTVKKVRDQERHTP